MLLDHAFFSDLRCSGGYHLEKDGMPLNDVFSSATTEYQGSGVKYMG